MSDLTHHRARVAAFAKHGEAEKLAAARRDLAVASVRRVVDEQRARLGLPPAADDLAAVVTGAAFLEAA